MLLLILAVVGVVVVWKLFKAKGGSVALPTTGGGQAQIDVHAAMQFLEDAIARQAREVEIETLAKIQAHTNIQNKADLHAKVAQSVAPVPKA